MPSDSRKNASLALAGVSALFLLMAVSVLYFRSEPQTSKNESTPKENVRKEYRPMFEAKRTVTGNRLGETSSSKSKNVGGRIIAPPRSHVFSAGSDESRKENELFEWATQSVKDSEKALEKEDWYKAEQILKDLLDRLKREGKFQDEVWLPFIAERHRDLWWALHNQEQFKEAFENVQKALDIHSEINTLRSEEAAQDFQLLGAAYMGLDEWNKAEENYLRSADIRNDLFGNLSWQMDDAYDTVKNFYDEILANQLDIGKGKEALETAKRGIIKIKAYNVPTDPSAQKALETFSDTMKAWDQPYLAEDLKTWFNKTYKN